MIATPRLPAERFVVRPPKLKFFAIAIIGVIACTLNTASAHLPKRVPGPDQIQAEILNVRSNRGTVYCSIYRAPGDGFPIVPRKALKFARSKVAYNRARCNFDDLPPGVYAVGMMHDENDNRKFDTNWMGRSTEGYGVSRDAARTFTIPRFTDAAFSYGGGTVRIVIHVRY
jgi:uncharacterized protein (DUF2141 family)